MWSQADAKLLLQTAITALDLTSAAGLSKRAADQSFATLNVPMLPSITDVVARSLLLKFEDIPFTSINDGIFSSFLLDTTVGMSKSFALQGAADSTYPPVFPHIYRSESHVSPRPAITSTAIGDLHLSGIAFAVETAVDGLQVRCTFPVPWRWMLMRMLCRDSMRSPRPSATSTSSMATQTICRSMVGQTRQGQRQPVLMSSFSANAHLFNPSKQITIGTGNVNFGLTFQARRARLLGPTLRALRLPSS